MLLLLLVCLRAAVGRIIVGNDERARRAESPREERRGRVEGRMVRMVVVVEVVPVGASRQRLRCLLAHVGRVCAGCSE